MQHVIDGKINRTEVTERRGRRRIRTSYDVMEARGYWKLQEEALNRSLWRNRCGRGFGPLVRQTADGICELKKLVKSDVQNYRSKATVIIIITKLCKNYIFNVIWSVLV
jgi:hypothetical protein